MFVQVAAVCAFRTKLRTSAQSTKPEPRVQLSEDVLIHILIEPFLSCGVLENSKLKPATPIDRDGGEFNALAFKFKSNLSKFNRLGN